MMVECEARSSVVVVVVVVAIVFLGRIYSPRFGLT